MHLTYNHDTLTNQLILDKVYRIFCSVAFDTLTLAQLSRLCRVSEETLVQAFGSMAELYQSAFHHALRQQTLMKVKPEQTPSSAWLSDLIEGYLSDAHIRGQQPGCPLSFLVSHTSDAEAVVRETYASAFLACSRWLSQYIEQQPANAHASSLLTSLIGAVNIARSLDNDASRHEYISRVKNDLYRRLQLPPVLSQ